MGPVRLQGPVGLSVDGVQECQIGVQPGSVGAEVVRRQLEGVFLVVELPEVQVAVDRVGSVLTEQLVLHKDTSEPLQAHRELADRDRFRGDGEQRSGRSAEHRGDVELDDDAQGVPSVGPVGAFDREGEPLGRERFDVSGGVDEERVHAQPGEDARAGRLGALLVVHAEGDHSTVRERARALLHEVPGAVRRYWRRERVGDVVLIGADLEARAGSASWDGHGPDAEPVAGGVGEQRSGLSVGEDGHDEHQLPGPGRTGEDVDVA